MPPSSAIFDGSGTLLLYPSLLGIKVVSLITNRLVRVMGKAESSERFVCLALHQGSASAAD
ncbi:hypothetical protein T492DRAFT_888835 [Pavlovales sp. CCMP2436]|nr:hypothetical protein T492DRAFT_888835 [Pavlovales sp. CCMP2436]